MTHKRTKIVQADIGTDKNYKAVSPPLYLAFMALKIWAPMIMGAAVILTVTRWATLYLTLKAGLAVLSPLPVWRRLIWSPIC